MVLMIYTSEILFKRVKRIRKDGNFGKGTVITYIAEILPKDKFILNTEITYNEYVQREIDITDNFRKALEWVRSRALNRSSAEQEFLRVWEKSK